MSDVIYTAVDGKQYIATPTPVNSCLGCAFRWDSKSCRESVHKKRCNNSPHIIWQPISIQKPIDNFHQWLQENAEMFRPIFERVEGKGQE